MARSIELQNEWAQTLTAARAVVDRAESEKRDLSVEEQTQYDAHMTALRSLEERIKRARFLEDNPLEGDEERFVWDRKQDEERAPKTEAESLAQKARAYRAVSHVYMRGGAGALTQEQRQVLSGPLYRTDPDSGQLTAVDQPDVRTAMRVERRQQEVSDVTSGGLWVPDEMMQRIEKALLWFGGMRQAAQVIQTDTGADLPWPVYDDTANTGRRLAEGAATARLDLTVGIRHLKAHMYTSDHVLVSYQLLQDAPLMSERLIADALGERIGRITNTEFTTYGAGDGPQGIITATTLGVTAAATGAVTADELEQLAFSVPVAYRQNLRWMWHDNTYRDILRLKDGEGRYLFAPDPRMGLNGVSIWGITGIVNNDMPTMATTNVAILCGDFSHYIIRDVRGFTLLRLNELFAQNLQVGFLGFSRHDGGYINAGQGPIRHLAMA